jgi:hypothetical protein
MPVDPQLCHDTIPDPELTAGLDTEAFPGDTLCGNTSNSNK